MLRIAHRKSYLFSVWTPGTTLSIFSPQAYSIATPPLSQFSHGARRKYFATEREQWRKSGRRRTLDLVRRPPVFSRYVVQDERRLQYLLLSL
ncbi:hypothetical protein ARMSODRAFT_960598 [Armillaria solidipes]|uniref:Uncharacterized protein n=1 Tax=Armillaria solidipes TaxID=1076256 RepID=A0A2H3BQL1_9AGAR|nr:hypothetical protein ARMSODRAFT_960598 [Armillaria solidipes]